MEPPFHPRSKMLFCSPYMFGQLWKPHPPHSNSSDYWPNGFVFPGGRSLVLPSRIHWLADPNVQRHHISSNEWPREVARVPVYWNPVVVEWVAIGADWGWQGFPQIVALRKCLTFKITCALGQNLGLLILYDDMTRNHLLEFQRNLILKDNRECRLEIDIYINIYILYSNIMFGSVVFPENE